MRRPQTIALSLMSTWLSSKTTLLEALRFVDASATSMLASSTSTLACLMRVRYFWFLESRLKNCICREDKVHSNPDTNVAFLRLY
ncbi:hypothetical protein DFH11DRAFT_1628049 [Phellopilus nigrolimitatus]|nr:hypothetical protein DFH11DRAFT_1628049 [Phellopilus nigrolimitatus]